MMALRRRVRSRLGDVLDITQPINIGGSLSTYYPSTDLLTAAPPITTSVIPGYVPNAGIASQIASESTAAQMAAAGQGFITGQSAGAWLSQNWMYVAGALVVGLFAFNSGGRRR